MNELCKTCGESVIWATHERTGKQALIDVEPSADGNILLIYPDPNELAQTALGPVDPEYRIVVWNTSLHVLLGSPPLRKSHFATCPQASMHRRGT